MKTLFHSFKVILLLLSFIVPLSNFIFAQWNYQGFTVYDLQDYSDQNYGNYYNIIQVDSNRYQYSCRDSNGINHFLIINEENEVLSVHPLNAPLNNVSIGTYHEKPDCYGQIHYSGYRALSQQNEQIWYHFATDTAGHVLWIDSAFVNSYFTAEPTTGFGGFKINSMESHAQNGYRIIPWNYGYDPSNQAQNDSIGLKVWNHSGNLILDYLYSTNPIQNLTSRKACMDNAGNYYMILDTFIDLNYQILSGNFVGYFAKNLLKIDPNGNLLWSKPIMQITNLNSFIVEEVRYLQFIDNSLVMTKRIFDGVDINGINPFAISEGVFSFDTAFTPIGNFLHPIILPYSDYGVDYHHFIHPINVSATGNPIFTVQTAWDTFLSGMPFAFEFDAQSGTLVWNSLSIPPNIMNVLSDFGTYTSFYRANGNLILISGYTGTFPNLLVIMEYDQSGNIVSSTSELNYFPLINTMADIPRFNNSNTFFFNKRHINYNNLNSRTFYKFNWCYGCSPNVSGRVFLDSLNDCLDAPDSPYPLTLLSFDNGQSFTFTDLNGNYTAILDSGFHTIAPNTQLTNYWLSTCQSLPISVNAPVSPNVSIGNDIPLGLLPNVHDIISFTSGTLVNPGFNSTSWVNIKNIGTVSESGILSLSYTDSIFDFLQAFPIPDSISQGYLHWNYTNLPIFSTLFIQLEWNIPTTISLGSPFEFTVAAGDISIDTFPLNNIDIYQGFVTGSYDPNDKQVFPKGTGPEGFITPQDSLLEYLIRFQNTGTDTAITVRVEDMIDTDLDLSTLQIEMASHPYTVQLQGRKLIFTFNNIMLPDSGANYAASNGFVQYTIEQKPGLPIGTEIKNIAAIYFDFNAPIITNMVTNTIDWATSVTETNLGSDMQFVKAYPNPFSGALTMEWNYLEPIRSLTIYNMQGQKMGDFTNLTKGNLFGKVDLGPQSALLPNGIYFLKVETETAIKVLKLVKQ